MNENFYDDSTNIRIEDAEDLLFNEQGVKIYGLRKQFVDTDLTAWVFREKFPYAYKVVNGDEVKIFPAYKFRIALNKMFQII